MGVCVDACVPACVLGVAGTAQHSAQGHHILRFWVCVRCCQWHRLMRACVSCLSAFSIACRSLLLSRVPPHSQLVHHEEDRVLTVREDARCQVGG